MAICANSSDLAARCGADLVGLNPLHVLFDQPGEASPYAPASRLLLNVLNIDLEAMLGVRDLGGGRAATRRRALHIGTGGVPRRASRRLCRRRRTQVRSVAIAL